MKSGKRPVLKYLMSTFIPLKKIVVITKMRSDGNGETSILKATDEGVPVRDEDALRIIQHYNMHDLKDLKRTHGKAVTNFFSPKFFRKMREKKKGRKGEVFFRLQVLIKQYGLFFSVTKQYNTKYATVKFFTEEFTYGKPKAAVTELKRIKAGKYSSILRESFKLLHIITTTIESVEERIFPIKEGILEQMEEKIDDTVAEFTKKMEQAFEKVKESMIKEFVKA